MLAIRIPLEESLAKSVLFVFDSSFSGTIFTDRSSGGAKPLSKEEVERLQGTQARDIITAGTSAETVPAHSPIPDLLLAAIDGRADEYGWGVVTSDEIRSYLLDGARSYNLTPQEGPLRDSAFAGGSFLFRVIKPSGEVPNESERLKHYRENASKGDPDAQVQLAVLYDNGRGGLPKDEREAARLYKLAADQGNALAQNNLGVDYRDGLGGLSNDNREAARLFKLAADHGNANAQLNLGRFYENGLGGLPKDEREAARLFKLAADHGNARAQFNLKLAADHKNAYAQFNLGVDYRDGLGGLPKDDREAARLFKLSADQGNANAQFNLGRFYENGLGGLPKNDREAAGLVRSSRSASATAMPASASA